MPTPIVSSKTIAPRDPAGSDARAALRSLVAAHPPRDRREREAKAQFLVELERLARPLDRGADRVHVTASAVVVGARGIVLHRHRRLRRWIQPGGHVDAGESPAEAALRETVEETGLEVAHPAQGPELLHLDVHPAADHVHLDLRFLLLAADEDPKPGPGESPAVRWFGWDEAEVLADAALAGALDAARSALQRSVDEH
ncbi:MAG: NUDIX domain-containing protein [Actinomycetota bacterium]|nr:NUDIX domain-containing protein [Actinomycetota bacterium]